ncbi:uncharacterized protein [Amphiura filiformis]|uniref:uncharacterized protein isoform X2 n=1 Tax=Amphiura filiformis TaxID=82378 RepID=UPI003B2120B4
MNVVMDVVVGVLLVTLSLLATQPLTRAQDVNPCRSQPCLNQGRCVDKSRGRYRCICRRGWTGRRCGTVADVNQCLSSPCLNGATCNDRIGSYTCTCAPGWTGVNCETDIDKCSAEPCQNGGTCENGILEYSCQCVPGFTGTNCEQEINECMSRPCLNGGKCVDELNQYSCVCQRGWTGINCQSITCEENEFLCDDGVGCVLECYRCDYIPDCNDNSDESGCTCIPSIQFQCLSGGCVHNSWLCDDFEDCFDGSDESNDTCHTIDNIDECAAEPCWNGASCQDSINTFVCLCPQGYTGTLCEQNINDCAPDPCLNGGTCEDGHNEYQCRCPVGYSGPNCEQVQVCPLEPELIIQRDAKINVMSSRYPNNYMNDMRCFWTVQGHEGGRILVQFIDFNTERYNDNLYIGTAQNGRLLKYTGNSLPDLDVLSPADASALYFEFYTDEIVPSRGFHICLTNVNAEDLVVCPGNQLEVIDVSMLCDGFNDCQDRSDEGNLANCYVCEIGPNITLPDNGMVFNLTSLNYPSNHFTSYDSDIICQWFVTTSAGSGEIQESEARSSIYIHFVDFDLYTNDAYLYFGRNEANWREVALTGRSLPLDMISPNGTDMIVITFEVRRYAFPRRGFYMELSEYTDAIDYVFCDNDWQILDRDDLICDGIYQCSDRSDEPEECYYCGNEPNITLPDSGMVFNLTSRNYPSNYIATGNDIICQWFVTTSAGSGEFQGLGARSSIFIHFVDFFLDYYDAYLYFGRNEANLREVALTGSSLPRDMISPNGTDMIVITFEVGRNAYPRRGFFMELSEYTDEIDYVFCDNDWEILGSEDLICDGIYQCRDGSDEPPECFCPEPELIIPRDTKVNLTSYGYPNNYMSNMRCFWTVRCQEGGRILVQFIDFYTERSDDNLYIGTAQYGRLLRYTGNYLPDLDVLSPSNESALHFEFSTDSYLSYRGFYIYLININAEDLVVCPGNQLEVIDESMFCDGFNDCQDRSDEGILGNCSVQECDFDEFQCFDGSCILGYQECDGTWDCPFNEDEIQCSSTCVPWEFTCSSDGSCIPGYWECDGTYNCPFGEDEIHCDMCGSINTTVIGTNESYTLEYFNYGNNAEYFYYGYNVDCQWTFNSTGERYIFVQFETFRLSIFGDFLQFGTLEDVDAYGRYSGARVPQDFLIADSFVRVTFTSDFFRPDLGFSITLSDVNPEDLIICSDGSGAFLEDPFCDGSVDCDDSSDERFCPPCVDVPPECTSLLSYNQTYFPNGLSSTLEEALGLFFDTQDCHANATWLLCSIIFPECQGEASTASPCRQQCRDIVDSCTNQFEDVLDDCDSFPADQEVSCSLPEGDYHGEGICGIRPAIRETRIVDGDDAVLGAWPWIGSLRHVSWGHNCGASLISESWAVTAAHCLAYGDYSDFSVVFGDSILDQTSNDEQVRDFDAVIIDQDFSGLPSDPHDIALLHLREPVTFTDFVRPICLTKTWQEIDSFEECWIAGWGSFNNTDYYDFSNILQEVAAPLLSQKDCRDYHIDNGRPDLAPPDIVICAGHISSGTGACRGDDGGPLVCRDSEDNRWHLVGITSFVVECGEWPTLFTRVSRFYSFIESTIRQYEEPGP